MIEKLSFYFTEITYFYRSLKILCELGPIFVIDFRTEIGKCAFSVNKWGKAFRSISMLEEKKCKKNYQQFVGEFL